MGATSAVDVTGGGLAPLSPECLPSQGKSAGVTASNCRHVADNRVALGCCKHARNCGARDC